MSVRACVRASKTCVSCTLRSVRYIKMGCLSTSIKLSVFKSDPGEVEFKEYQKHREFRDFCEKMKKVSGRVSDGSGQNSAKLAPPQQCDFKKY